MESFRASRVNTDSGRKIIWPKTTPIHKQQLNQSSPSQRSTKMIINTRNSKSIIVEFNSNTIKARAIKNARKLSDNATCKNVFVIPDLTPQQKSLDYDLRAKRRENTLKTVNPRNPTVKSTACNVFTGIIGHDR